MKMILLLAMLVYQTSCGVVPVESSTPATVESSSPATVESSTPATVESSTPVAVESSAPVLEESSAPAPEESSTPATVESSAPAAVESSTPPAAESSTPAAAASSAPPAAESSTPAPVESSNTIYYDAWGKPENLEGKTIYYDKWGTPYYINSWGTNSYLATKEDWNWTQAKVDEIVRIGTENAISRGWKYGENNTIEKNSWGNPINTEHLPYSSARQGILNDPEYLEGVLGKTGWFKIIAVDCGGYWEIYFVY